MAHESIRGAGRDASGPHAFTIQIEKFLREHPEGTTLDEIVAVAVDRRWVSRGYAHRAYARQLNRHSLAFKIGKSSPDGSATLNDLPWTPERVMLEGRTERAIRYVIATTLKNGARRWCTKGDDGRWFATGKGFRVKYQGGFTDEQIHATPEQISRDVIERELIRALKPHMGKKTHKLTPGEWELLSKWVQLSVVGWQP